MTAPLSSGAVFAEAYVDEVVVKGAVEEAPVPTVLYDDLALDLGSFAAEQPGLSLSTNSRGEVGLAIRGRSEREARILINGYTLFDPWDERLNLANLPGASFSGSLLALGHAQSGPGGLLMLETTKAEQTRATFEAGDFGFARGHGILARPGAMIAVEGFSRDGVRAPNNAALPFSQSDLSTRTNTDREQASILASSQGEFRGLALDGLALVSSSDYGVAPESHLDPEVANVRFWQVPEDQRLFFGSSVSTTRRDVQITLKGWAHGARQKINAFDDASYTSIERTETSSDLAYGFDTVLNGSSWDLGASWNDAHHDEQETGRQQDEFSRQSFAFWGATKRSLGGSLSLATDLRHEGFVTGQTGGRESGSDLSLTTGRVEMRSSGPLSWTLTAARIGRLPTQRELYGEALGRFLVNPNLNAERAWAGEGSVHLTNEKHKLNITTFIEDRSDVISQQVVASPDGNLRQRINTEGYLAYGFEAEIQTRISDALSLQGHATLTRYDRRGDASFLTERPTRQVQAALSYQPTSAFDGRLRLRHQSGAFSLDDTGGRVKLPSGTAVDLEAGVVFSRSYRGYLRLENAFDAEVVPQLGLPAPGRAVRFGVSWVL